MTIATSPTSSRPVAGPSGPADKWPIEISAVDWSPECNGAIWTITDEQMLARYVARLVVGQSLAVERVLRDLDSALSPHAPGESAIDAAIKELAPPESRELRWRRDGWVFQLIAWVAAYRSAQPGDRIRSPQIRKAEHGIDGMILHLSSDGAAVSGVSICEQKATDNARNHIQQKVWEDFKKYEAGVRDNQLVGEVTALLEKVAPERALELAADINWRDKRRYRVAVTFDKGPTAALFDGFKAVIIGDEVRRSGEVLQVAALRNWLDDFCVSVTAELEVLKACKDESYV